MHIFSESFLGVLSFNVEIIWVNKLRIRDEKTKNENLTIKSVDFTARCFFNVLENYVLALTFALTLENARQ